MSCFSIIPAIDLKDGRCVRLRQGKSEDQTIYSDKPLEIAEQWVQQGAGLIHVVDLDGAFEGKPVHKDLILNMVAETGARIEVGGGIRTRTHMADYLENGVARVILGTRACAEPNELSGLVEEFGDRIAVGIDARDGFVQVKGWVETTGVQASELALRVEASGVATIIYTDTARDGMLGGVNADAVGAMCDAVSCDVVASGGVSSSSDISALLALKRKNLAGVIVGKALYDGQATLADLQGMVSGEAKI